MSYSLNCLKAGYVGDYVRFRVWGLNALKAGYIGDYIGSIHTVFKGDTRSLDYSSYMGG